MEKEDIFLSIDPFFGVLKPAQKRVLFSFAKKSREDKTKVFFWFVNGQTRDDGRLISCALLVTICHFIIALFFQQN